MKPAPASRRISRLVTITFTLVAAGQSYTLSPSGRFVLRPLAARKIFQQCSRPAPSARSQLWEPSTKDIDDLELSLTKYLDERGKTGKPNPPKSTRYRRQYVGFLRKGERFIYGNFYPADLYAPSEKFRIDESKQAVQICDGGAVFWGIVYRVKTKTFEEPYFNGVA